MCLAVPACILAIPDRQAEIDLGDVQRTGSRWLTPAAWVGDYVYVHAGYAISVVDAQEAAESLCLLEELATSHEGAELFRSAAGDGPLLNATGPPLGAVVGPLVGLESM